MPSSIGNVGKNSQISTTQNTTTQIDNRLAATENARVVGAGGYLDDSYEYTDNSSTLIDSSDRSSYAYTDSSNTQIDSSDRRVFSDNSTTTVYSLDGQTIEATADALNAAAINNANVLYATVANNNATLQAIAEGANAFADAERTASYNLATQSLAYSNENLEIFLESSLAESDKTREFTTGFIKDFYTSQQDSSERISTDLLTTVKQLGFAVAGFLALRALFA